MVVIPIKERYVIDENRNRVAVRLAMEDYQKLLEELELLESIRAYDAAKASADEVIPFEQAISEIEHNR
jgi:PHD/YefM family antitoxin component YafN of YafNO toxin-antitoxin module